MKRYKSQFTEAVLSSEPEGAMLGVASYDDEDSTTLRQPELTHQEYESIQDVLAGCLDEDEVADGIISIIDKIIPPKFDSNEVMLKLKQRI